MVGSGCGALRCSTVCSHPTTQRPTTATNHSKQNQRSTPYAVTHGLCSPEDGHNDARNMLWECWLINIWLLHLVDFLSLSLSSQFATISLLKRSSERVLTVHSNNVPFRNKAWLLSGGGTECLASVLTVTFGTTRIADVRSKRRPFYQFLLEDEWKEYGHISKVLPGIEPGTSSLEPKCPNKVCHHTSLLNKDCAITTLAETTANPSTFFVGVSWSYQ